MKYDIVSQLYQYFNKIGIEIEGKLKDNIDLIDEINKSNIYELDGLKLENDGKMQSNHIENISLGLNKKIRHVYLDSKQFFVEVTRESDLENPTDDISMSFVYNGDVIDVFYDRKGCSADVNIYSNCEDLDLITDDVLPDYSRHLWVPKDEKYASTSGEEYHSHSEGEFIDLSRPEGMNIYNFLKMIGLKVQDTYYKSIDISVHPATK